MKTATVRVVGGKTVRTADNPLNSWVRSLDDGQFYPQPLYDKCEDISGTDIDARRVPASVVEGRARHHVFEEMEREGD